MNSVGHDDSLSIQPIFTRTVAFLIISSVIIFGFCLLMSIPYSFITSIAKGLTSPDGFVPALIAAYTRGAYFLKKPSAIWFLPEFATHTNNTASCSSFDFFNLLNNFITIL